MNNNIIRHIRNDMDHAELTQILLAAVKGWSRLHPEEELVILSLPKGDRQMREHLLEESRKMLLSE